MNRWYIIKTKPQKEENVIRLIQRATFDVFCPKIRETSYAKNTKNAKKIALFRTRPLFPSYLFLNIDFDRGENIHLIKYTRGVSRILCAEGKPLPLDPQIIHAIKERADHQGIITHHSTLNPGDPIRVKKGILKDLIGVLEKPATSEERVIVLLKLVNYEMKANLHWTEIEKLNAA